MDITLSRSVSESPHNRSARLIPVLFIACAGRSGSTLLDRVIGMHDGFCSVGELRFIWDRAFGENQLCGCGKPFAECDFWNEVSRVAFGIKPGEVDATTAISLRGALDEARYAPWLLQSRSPAYHEAALRVYGRLLEALYEKILDVSRDQVIVDSSGDATHGLILSKLPGVELHVVHLIRDPRAVAFSWKRMRRRPEIRWTSEHMPIEHIRTSAIRWLMNNGMAERLSKASESYSRVRYEDFVKNPSAELAKILAPFDWVTGESAKLTAGQILLEPSHTVSGNPMRFNSGPLTIRLDDEWRVRMSRGDRRAVVAMTWPLLARYGYPVRTNG